MRLVVGASGFLTFQMVFLVEAHPPFGIRIFTVAGVRDNMADRMASRARLPQNGSWPYPAGKDQQEGKTKNIRHTAAPENNDRFQKGILEENHYQIELLANLDEVPEAGALVVAAFPKPKDGSGFPARVFAILP